MAIGERRKLTNKYRLAATASVLAYEDMAKQLRQDPLHLTGLPVGTILLGAELSKALGKKTGPNDGVWWVSLDPKTGKMVGRKQLGSDLSKWQRQLSRQLKDWDQTSEIGQQQSKRNRNAGFVASLLVTAAVAAGLISRSDRVEEETALTEETWLGHENWVTSGAILQPALECVTSSSDLSEQAQAMQGALPAKLSAAAEKDAEPKAHGLEVAAGITGVATIGLAAFGVWLLYKGYKQAQSQADEDEEE